MTVRVQSLISLGSLVQARKGLTCQGVARESVGIAWNLLGLVSRTSDHVTSYHVCPSIKTKISSAVSAVTMHYGAAKQGREEVIKHKARFGTPLY